MLTVARRSAYSRKLCRYTKARVPMIRVRHQARFPRHASDDRRYCGSSWQITLTATAVLIDSVTRLVRRSGRNFKGEVPKARRNVDGATEGISNLPMFSIDMGEGFLVGRGSFLISCSVLSCVCIG